MTVTRRDVAARCDRCSRVTLGVRPVGLSVAGETGTTYNFCVRCTGEVADALWLAMHDPETAGNRIAQRARG